MKYKVLVVDDDEGIIELIKTAFSEEKDFQISIAETGKKALQIINSFKPHIILLDVMLPDMAGYEISGKLRAEDNFTPVIFMSGKKIDQEDKAAGFLSGADDYVIKPFAPRELLFRVKAVLNRTNREAQMHKDYKIDPDNFLIYIGPQKIEGLTPTEFKILSLLLSKSPNIVNKDEIVKTIWAIVNPSTYRSLEVYIQRLRKKLGPEIGNKIETVPTKGYRYSA
ncbi:MAG: response regulator transcription factor [Elusimicrobiota bacterium]